MDLWTVRLLAVASVVAIVTAGAVAILRFVRAGAALTALLGVFFLAVSASTVIEWLRDRAEFVHRYGLAAVDQVPLSATIAGTATVVFVLSLLALRHKAWAFWIAWILSWPLVAGMVFLAFFFKIRF